jgi:hypothetical protein
MSCTFVAIYSNKRKKTLSEKLLSEHIEHLKKLYRQGKLIICGPYKNNDQAIQILRVKDEKEANDLVLADPFIRERYYQDFTLNEFFEAHERNDYLKTNPQTKENLK